MAEKKKNDKSFKPLTSEELWKSINQVRQLQDNPDFGLQTSGLFQDTFVSKTLAPTIEGNKNVNPDLKVVEDARNNLQYNPLGVQGFNPNYPDLALIKPVQTLDLPKPPVEGKSSRTEPPYTPRPPVKPPTTLERIPGLDKDYSTIDMKRKKDWRDAVNTENAVLSEGITNALMNVIKKNQAITNAEEAFGTKAKGGMIEVPMSRQKLLELELLKTKIANGQMEPLLIQAKINDLASQLNVDKAYIAKLLSGGDGMSPFDENNPNAGNAIKQDEAQSNFDKQMEQKYGADWKKKLEQK